MQSRIVLVSDDSDFFEYIRQKLRLRRSDEMFLYSFDKLPSSLHLIKNSLLIINSEEAQDKTLDLLRLLKGTPAVVFAYNEDPLFKLKAYKSGAMAYLTPYMEEEFEARLIAPLSVVGLLEQNSRYRELLVRNNLLMPNNEVFIDYEYILDKELEKINSSGLKAVLVAIAPNDKTKFLVQQNKIETLILSSIRKTDLLMNFAPSKYFLILYNTDIEAAKKMWEKIRTKLEEKIFAGFVKITSETRQQLINKVLNRLHEAINYNKDRNENLAKDTAIDGINKNFKIFRQEFKKKIDNIVVPVFYQVQQKYSEKLFGIIIEQSFGEGYGNLLLKGRRCEGDFSITTPGFSKINIDITYKSDKIDSKRITLEPEELEAGLLEDLIEQFIIEFKEEVNNDSSQY